MGKIRQTAWVRPLCGVLACESGGLTEAEQELRTLWGDVAAATAPEPFQYTQYYDREMGPGLWRQFLVFRTLHDPAQLADWKLATNALERGLGNNPAGGRRLNLDPGYLAPGKLVLASTKDHEQRIYLKNGIYAEVTMRIRQGRFLPWEWTYPDYAAQREFFDAAYRAYLQDVSASSQHTQPQGRKEE